LELVYIGLYRAPMFFYIKME